MRCNSVQCRKCGTGPTSIWGLGWCAAMMSLFIFLTTLAPAAVEAQPSPDQVKAAQRMLGALGYDLGEPDGKMGPKTRRAIEAFQLTYNLPLSRELDSLTLNALGLAPKDSSPEGEANPLPLTPSAPWRVVLDYLRYFDTQPARLLQYVTDGFRQGVSPRDWIRQTSRTLSKQKFSRLSWQIERIEADPSRPDSQATIHVHSRVRISGEEIARREIFQVVRANEAEWLISSWSSSTLPANNQETVSGR